MGPKPSKTLTRLLCGVQAVNSLAAQRTLFTDITAKLGTVGAKFPVVNSLVTAIRRKKSKVRRRAAPWAARALC